MTLDEAIKHAEEVMTENLEKTKGRNASDPIAINCFECADEHRKLAEWLKELKRHREAWQKVMEEIGKEVECTDVSLKYREYQLGVDYGLGFALGVIDNALGKVGEQDE